MRLILVIACVYGLVAGPPPVRAEVPDDLDAFLEGIKELLRSAEFTRAEETLRPVLASVRAQFGPDSPEAARIEITVVQVIRNLGTSYREEIESLLAHGEEIFSSPEHRDDEKLALVYTLQGGHLTFHSRYAEAKVVQKKSIEVQERLKGTSHELATALAFYTWTLVNLQELEEAEAVARRALAIREELGQSDEIDASFHHWHLARIAEIRNDLPAARDHYARCLEIRRLRSGDDHQFVGEVLIPIGWVDYRLGNYAAAEENYLEAQRILEALGEAGWAGLAWVQNNLAILYDMQGRLDRAVSMYRKSLELKSRIYDPGHALVLATKLNLATQLQDMDQVEEVEDILREVIAGFENLFDAHEDLELAYLQWGKTRQKLGDYDEAEEYFLKALTMGEVLRGQGRPRWGIRLHLSVLARLRGDLEAAREHLAHAEAATSEFVPPSMQIELRTQYAYIAGAEGHLTEARRELQENLELQREIFGPGQLGVAGLEYDIALYSRSLGELDTALDWALRALETSRVSFATVAPGLPEALALDRHARNQGFESLPLSILASLPHPTAEDVGRGWASVSASRGLVLRTLLERRRVIAQANSPHAPAWERVRLARQELAHAFMRLTQDATDDARRTAVAEAETRRDAAENELAAALGWVEVPSANRSVPVARLAERRPPGAALVGFVKFAKFVQEDIRGAPKWEWLDEYTYGAFVLSPHRTRPVFVALSAAAEIDAAIDAWHEEASRGERMSGRSPRGARQALRAAAAPVRELVWNPLREHLGTASEIIWIPAGALHRHSPGALSQPDGSFWLESGVTFHRLATEHDLLLDETAPATGLLAMGDVSYDELATAGIAASDLALRSGAPCLDRVSSPFRAIPNTGTELDEVEKSWPDSSELILRGPRASEAAFYREAPGRRVIHLATHAFFLSEDCTGDLDVDEINDSPLVRSGLALAGANLEPPAVGHDGILTAEEIATMNLSGTERVVLSACDTSAGVVRLGEGAMGLARSFLVAGANQVVMSLWPVADRSTSEFMSEYYRTGATISETQRTRLKALREAGASDHPSHWAGFVSMGRRVQLTP